MIAGSSASVRTPDARLSSCERPLPARNGPRLTVRAEPRRRIMKSIVATLYRFSATVL